MAYGNDISTERKAGVGFFVAICIVFALFLEAVNLGYLYLTYAPMPFGDTWDNITREQLLTHFFSHHNEHRIVVPRLFFLIDTFLFGGRQVFLITMTHLMFILYGCLIGFVASRLLDVGRLAQVALSALFSGIFLSLQQRNILEWGFMVAWPLVYVFAILSYVVIFGKRASLAVAFALALLSSLSLANGALSLLPVVVVAFFQRDVKLLVFALVGSVLLLALYYWGLAPPSVPNAHGSVVDVIKFSLAYVGGPVALVLDYLFRSGPDPQAMGGPGVDPFLSFWTGGAIVAIFSGLSLKVSMQGRAAEWPPLVLVSTGGFVLVTALATAWGRVVLGLKSAADGRYGMGGTLFTVCAALLLVDALIWRWKAAKVPIVAATAALMLVLSSHQIHIAKRDRDWASLRKMPMSAMLSGVDDQFVMGLAYPYREQFAALLEGVKREKLGPFSEPWADWIGKPMPLPIKTGACSGAVEGSDPVDGAPGAFRVRGWATRPGEGLANERLIFVDKNGVVVGYGFNGWLTDKVKPALPFFSSSLSGWYGHIRSGAVEPVEPYLLLDGDKSACPLNS